MTAKSATREGVLNARQLRFIDEYLVDLNATQAAIRAGYSKRTASEQGYALLRNPQVAPAIEAKRKELAHATGVTRERVIQELAGIAFFDVRKLFNEAGAMKPIHDLDDETARAIASIEIESPTERSPVWTKKVKAWDKKGALEALLKHLGLDQDKPADDVGVVSGLAALTAKLDKLVPLKAVA